MIAAEKFPEGSFEQMLAQAIVYGVLAALALVVIASVVILIAVWRGWGEGPGTGSSGPG